MLEERRGAVFGLYEKISKDTRHWQTVVNTSEALACRQYNLWMAIDVIEPLGPMSPLVTATVSNSSDYTRCCTLM